MRQLYKQIGEGGDRTESFFTYKKVKSNHPHAKPHQALYSWTFAPTKKRIFLFYLNLMPQRVRPLAGLKYAKIKS